MWSKFIDILIDLYYLDFQLFLALHVYECVKFTNYNEREREIPLSKERGSDAGGIKGDEWKNEKQTRVHCKNVIN